MLLYISLTTCALSILLSIYNWQRNKTAIYLSLFLLSISFYGITHFFTVYGENPFWLAIFYNHFTPLNLLAGPALFFYIRGTLTDKQGIRGPDLWHFIPVLIHLVGILPYSFSPFEYKVQTARAIIENLNYLQSVKSNIIFTVSTAFFIRPTLLLIYTGYCVFLLWKYRMSSRNKVNIPSKQFKITYRWLLILIANVCLMSLNFLYLTIIFINTSAKDTISNSTNLYHVSGILFGLMALGLLFFPQVLYGIPQYRQTDEVEKNLDLNKRAEDSSSVENITENDEPFLKLADRIKEHVRVNKPFTNPEFSIEHLAAELQVPLNHISYCLNKVLQVKFTAYRMKLRIDFAKELLKAGKNNEFTIEGIAQQAGFSTRSNFYNAFKTETGFTPTDFLKMKDN